MKLDAYKDQQTGIVLLVNRDNQPDQPLKQICFTKEVKGYELIGTTITKLEEEAGFKDNEDK